MYQHRTYMGLHGLCRDCQYVNVCMYIGPCVLSVVQLCSMHVRPAMIVFEPTSLHVVGGGQCQRQCWGQQLSAQTQRFQCQRHHPPACWHQASLELFSMLVSGQWLSA